MAAFKEYINCKKGTIPLILSVSHGGTLECEEIPKRSSGILGIDKGTISLANGLISYIKSISLRDLSIEYTPSFIISKVRRSRIDLNRKSTEAYNLDSLLAKEIYEFYHKTLKELIISNIRHFNRSLLVDIHGFEKHKRPPGYRDVEIVLGTNNLKSLFFEPISKRDWDKNVRGQIINKFHELDIPIAPTHPRRKEYVLTGGFISQQYGASQIPESQAIQIEFSDIIRFHDKNLRTKVLKALAEILIEEII